MTIISEFDDLLLIDDVEARTDAYLRRVEELVPLLRDDASASEAARNTTPRIIAAAIEQGFFAGPVPRRWGGLGLGFRAIAESARILSHGDVSSAWQLCFLMSHNWLACRLPWSTQETLYSDDNYILAAAPLAPSGKARRVEGGFSVTGRHQYASGFPNAGWSFYAAMLEIDGADPEHWVFLSPKADLHDNDDWHFAGATASGSGSFSTNDTFVPDGWAMPYNTFMSNEGHDGEAHEEPLMRYRASSGLVVMVSGFACGAAERMVELSRERLSQHMIFGHRRIDQSAPRMRWAEGHERARTIRLLFDHLVATVEERGEDAWTGEHLAQLHLDAAFLVRQAKEAVQLLMGGAGSSAFHKENPMQRYLTDVEVVSNHTVTDWDWQVDTCAAALLGKGQFAGYGVSARADGTREKI